MITDNSGASSYAASRSGKTDRKDRLHFGRVALAAATLILCAGSFAKALASEPFLPAQGSTVPSNGDLNPYGLAFVSESSQLLVSNFNNGATRKNPGGLQGQGSTIVTIDPNTAQQVGLFFQGTPPIGFTNALSVLQKGFVLAGSVFTVGKSTRAHSGGLFIFDLNGHEEPNITTGINGAWGLAVNDQGTAAQLFVSNVLDFDPRSKTNRLSPECTITRLDVSLTGGALQLIGNPTTIGSGYLCGPDSAALVVGPAGLVYNSSADTLFVAAEGDNQIFAINKASQIDSPAGKGTLVYEDQQHLHGPLGLMIAPNGDFITANADPASVTSNQTQPSELIEFTPEGNFVRQFSIDPNPGSAFAILNFPLGSANLLAFVDDATSTVSILGLSPF